MLASPRNCINVPNIDMMWAARKPVLLQTWWKRSEPAKIAPSGKITGATPLEQIICKRGFAADHGRNAVVARRETGVSSGFVFRTHYSHGEEEKSAIGSVDSA